VDIRNECAIKSVEATPSLMMNKNSRGNMLEFYRRDKQELRDIPVKEGA
jgi:hypothetical protein